jgi:serine O-acetyltransferase
MSINFWFNLGSYFYRKRIPIIPSICNALIRFLFNSAVYSQTKIGKECLFAYGGIAVVIHKNAVLGDGVTISQNVTIGGRSGHKDVPKIGDNVYIGAGAKVLGPIYVGDNAIIGANAVVIGNVEPNSVVAGVPAKVIK